MSNTGKVWMNGKLVPWAEATVPLLSHGFSRASAVFEVFGVHQGPEGVVAFRMDEHLKRLDRSVELLGMRMAYSTGEITAAVAETVKANGMIRGLIKILTYWSEEALIDLVLHAPLDMAIFAIPTGDDPDTPRPISACISKWRKIHPETVPVTAKACSNYLNGYLARRDANERGFDVGLLVGTDGFMAEGSIEAFFMVKDGVLQTPAPGRILNSITRLSIVQAAPAAGIPVRETIVTPEELRAADEIFTSHSVIKVSPVGRFEDRTLQAPGPVTQRVMTLMDDIFNFRNDQFRHWFRPLD